MAASARSEPSSESVLGTSRRRTETAASAATESVRVAKNALMRHDSMANQEIVETENNRVLQRTLIAEFRAFFIHGMERYFPGQDAPKGVKMVKHNSLLPGTPTCFEVEIALEQRLRAKPPVSFKASAADAPQVNGQWRFDGKHEGRDAFCRIIDRDIVIQWCSEAMAWRLGTRDDESHFLYRLPDPEQRVDLPSSGWQLVTSAETSRAPVMEDCSAFDFFEVFDHSWESRQPKLSDCAAGSHWCEVKGPYGESILSWLWHLQSHDKRHPQIVLAYKSIMMGILTSKPELAGCVMNKEPYIGETILHQACAAGDVGMVDWIVNNHSIRDQDFFQREFLDGHLTGSFLKDILKHPERLAPLVDLAQVPDSDKSLNGSTPICVAMMAPHNDDDSVAIVRLLIRAGAKTIYYDSSKTEDVRYTIFHVIAASSWWDGWEHSPVLSKTRISRLLSIFLDQHSEFHHLGHQMVSLPNLLNYTPLHVCAMFGNEDCFIELLDRMKIPVWDWGKKREVGFPLRELDSGARDEEIAALELMTLYKHGNLLTLGIMTSIIKKKWDLFGNLWTQRFVVMQILGCIGTAVVCLDDTEGYSGLRMASKQIVVTLSGSFLLASLLLWIFCARDEQWFKHMDTSILGSRDNRISLWDQICFRNFVEMSYMLVLVLTPPWYSNEHLRNHSTYSFIWHTVASAWFLMFITFSLRYFELWRNTVAMATTLPEVIFRDMLPFGSFYFVILICSAISMRISVETQAEQADHAFGSFKNTLWTMEEAIHGPDVMWRNAVENHPMAAGAIFVGFLWITLVMMSILIAMFGTTWDDLKATVNEQFLFRRAMFCITLEKLFPQSYHRHPSWGPSGCNIGHPLGAEVPVDSDSDSESEVDAEAGEQQALIRRSQVRRSEALQKAEEEAKWKKLNDRWLLWSGGEHTFSKWHQDTEHKGQQHL